MYSSVQTQQTTLNGQLQSLKQKNLEEENLLSEKNNYTSKINFLYNSLISQNSITLWVAQENEIAQLSGLSGNNIVFSNATVTSKAIKIVSPTSSSTTSNTLLVNISIIGNFESTLEFLTMIENSYYATNITGVNIALQKGTTVLNTGITLDLYIQ